MVNVPRQPVSPDPLSVGEWTTASAEAIEDLLAHILGRLATVLQLEGASWEERHDHKVAFRHAGSALPSNSYLLAYDPEGQAMRGWAGGLWYPFPTDVIDHLGRTFPGATYSGNDGPQGDHRWQVISLNELHAAALGRAEKAAEEA